MAAEPYEQQEIKRVDYFPNTPMFHYLTKMLYMHGLFFDQHVVWRKVQVSTRAGIIAIALLGMPQS